MQTSFKINELKRAIYFFKKQHLLLLFFAFLFASCKKEIKSLETDNPLSVEKNTLRKSSGGPATVTTFFTGLNSPRGLEWGPDGNLYVAEGGTGGTHSSLLDNCLQVPFPVGPFFGSPTGGRISKITPAGIRTTVTDQLPSDQNNIIIGGDISGVADLTFIGTTLYAVISAGGCSHGNPTIPNQVVRVNSNGTWTTVANLSAWFPTHPVQHPEEDDFEPDGDPYSMINLHGDLYLIEANHGELLKVTTDGNITRVVDISASQGHIVPTTLAYHGNFFVGNLNTFPIVDGSSKIMKITPSGQLKDWVTGLTTVLGLVIDKADRMYVLENSVGVPGPPQFRFPTPGFGQIIRVNPNGSKEVIATGLSLPTGMTMGPDGNLYVSNFGFGPGATGGGQVLKVTLNN